jgi:hypothetical protein
MEQPVKDAAVAPEESGATTLSRRRLLKVIAATSGAAAAATMVPGKWAKPVVEIGVLPAHAQVSPPLGTGDLQVTLTWNTGGQPGAAACVAGNPLATDVDVHVIEPDGTHVFFAHRQGTTAELDYDNLVGFGPENIYVQPGHAASGTYHTYVVYYCGTPPTIATIRVRVFANTPQEQVVTFTRSLGQGDPTAGFNVADVTFPAGTITETSGTRPAQLSPEEVQTK